MKFGNNSEMLCGGLGAISVTLRQTAIAIEFGHWLSKLVSWLKNGGITTFRVNFGSPMMTSDFLETFQYVGSLQAVIRQFHSVFR
jgi:hypothetical protein